MAGAAALSKAPASSSRTARQALSLLWALALAWSAAAGASPAPVAESRRLFAALPGAQWAGVAVVEGPAELDATGWSARLRVEQRLAGGGAPERIAWEELATSRPTRFADGERLLLVLEGLPTGSLWARRFPAGSRRGVLAVAQGGEAFVRQPSEGSVRILGHYLALPAEARRGPDGLRHLLALAARAEAALAVSAAVVLPGIDPEVELGPETAELLLDALQRPPRDAERVDALLDWVARRRPPALAPALESRLTADPDPLLVLAQGALHGSIDDGRAELLLQDEDPRLRRAAARNAGPQQGERLRTMLRDDPDPGVRSSAVDRLWELNGAAALDDILAAFDDPDAAVRARAAGAAARCGPAAERRLEDVAARRPDPAPQTAVLALRMMETPAARAALERIAGEHSDPKVRALARVALGRPLGDHAHGP